MSSPDRAFDGLPARSVFHHMSAPPIRRRTVFERLKLALRDHAGMAVFVVMLLASAALVVLSR